MNFGEFLITGFEGKAVSKTLKRLILKHNLFGVILFSRNFESASQIRSLCRELQELKKKVSSFPLLIAIDYEGGFVSRFPQALPSLPSAASQAKSASPLWTRKLYYENALHLKALGINCNFAPVLDVPASKDHNIGIRAFSADAETVALFGKASIRGIQEGGILACGKHFPGLGRTRLDPHFSLPVVSESLSAFRRCDLVPFMQGIKAGLDLMMTSHVHYKAFDSENPGTLSAAINTGLLREKMGFRGLLVSDDLCMKAMKGSLSELSLNAFLSGVDIPMICHSLEEVEEVIRCNTPKLSTPEGLERVKETKERMQRVLARLSVQSRKKTPALSKTEEKTLQRKKESIAVNALEVVKSFKTVEIKKEETPLLLYSDLLASNNAEEDFGIPGLRGMLLSLFPNLEAAPLSKGLEKIKALSSCRLFLAASGLPDDIAETPLLMFLKKQGIKIEISFCVKNPSDIRKIASLSRNILLTSGLQKENIQALKRFLVSKKDEIRYASFDVNRGRKNGQSKKVD